MTCLVKGEAVTSKASRSISIQARRFPTKDGYLRPRGLKNSTENGWHPLRIPRSAQSSQESSCRQACEPNNCATELLIMRLRYDHISVREGSEDHKGDSDVALGTKPFKIVILEQPVLKLFQTFMALTILATAMKSMDWLRGAVDASTYVSSLSSEGNVSATDAIDPHLVLLRPLSAPIIEAIWESKTLTASIVLGLVIIFAVRYLRSPWRKLPPSPRRLPIIGNALQFTDKSWLLSKDCKERFGEFYDQIVSSGRC